MTTCFGKSCSFNLLCVSFVDIYRFVCALLSLGFEGRMSDLIELVPDNAFLFTLRGYVFIWQEYRSPQFVGGYLTNM